MNDLNKNVINSETDKIMDRIYMMNEKKRHKFIIFLYPALSVSFILFFVLSFSGIFNSNSNNLTLMKVSAKEYKLYNDDRLLYININTLVENEELIEFNEDISYYANLNKYIDVSDRTNLEIVMIKDKEFLKVTIDNRIYKYFTIYGNELTFLLFELDYKYTNFEEEMKLILELMEQYPPTVKEVNYNSNFIPYIYNEYTENPSAKIELNVNEYELYSWYIKRLDEISLYKPETDDSNGFITSIYMDGNANSLGNIKDIQYTYIRTGTERSNKDQATHEFPAKIKNCPTGEIQINLGDIQIHFDYASIECTNNTYKDSAVISMIIDFSSYTNKLELKNYDVNINLRGNDDDYTVPDEYFLVDGNKLYVMPVPIKFAKGDTGIHLTPFVIIKDNEGKVLFNDTPETVPILQWDNPRYNQYK